MLRGKGGNGFLEPVVVHQATRVDGADTITVGVTVVLASLHEGPTTQGLAVHGQVPTRRVGVGVTPQRVVDVGTGGGTAGTEAVALASQVVSDFDVITGEPLIVLQVVVVGGVSVRSEEHTSELQSR